MTKLSCGKKTTSGRLLGCVIFFPRLTYVVNRGVRGRWVAPLYEVRGSAAGIFFFGPYIRLGKPTYGFWSMVLDAMVFSVHGIGCFGMYKYVL